ncbi:MAG: hypothetical protein DRP76_01910 [Candidatus Omnitrophota bacterium]|nr:MAG: hypothetical protein DRP76_01910 [Candidatus Omnitrophota bacterium]
MRKIVIIGLDGVPFELIKDFSDKGVMPNTSQIIQEGDLKYMSSSLPEVSSVAWSSIITGKNPAEHGIFGFTELYPYSYNLRFPSFADLKAKPFWEEVQKDSIIINVPATYPVKEMRGVHISGFISIDLERSVYPKELIPKLKEFGYRLDVDSEKAHTSLELFLEDLDKTLSARIKAYRYFWESYKWGIFMLVFTGTDRLMHFLWSAYEDKNNKYHQHFLNHFRKIDEVIGEINNRLNRDDLLILLSDHGFEMLDKDVYINYLLREKGFLQFEDTQPEWRNISSESLAFALDPARIYLNLKGKYPKGRLGREDKEIVLQDLEGLFSSLEVEGKKVIKSIYRKEEIYKGPFLESAPDLVLVGEKGFNLKANIKAKNLSDKGIFTGKHTQDNAFLLINRDLLKNSSKKTSVFDVAKIVIENSENS